MQLQRLVANTSAPNTKGASRALKLLLDGDPAVEANAAPLVEWATAAWDVSGPAYDAVQPAVAGAVAAQRRDGDTDEQLPATGAEMAPCGVQEVDRDQDAVAGAVLAQHCIPVNGNQPSATGALEAPCDDGSHNMCDLAFGSKLRAKQLHKLIELANEDARSGSWDTVRGPASAAVLTARRLGWRFNDGTSVTDEYGSIIDMARVAPSSVRSAVERATVKCTAASAAERWGRPEFARGIWVRPVRTALGRIGPAAKAALRRIWTGGYWSRARLADNALVESAECERCGAARDDAYHRIWECTCNDDKRNAATTPQLRAEAARASRDDWRFTRGLVPNVWAQLPRPRWDYEEVHVGPDGEELVEPLDIDGPVFVDGSALWPASPDARRAGWSIVTIDAEGRLRGAVYGHLPWGESDEQTPGHAEMYALRRAAQLVTGPLVVYTDYREAAEGVHKGSAATTGPRAKHAAHWRAFWTAVEDREYKIVKVKGHATSAQVENDAELKWRRSGNILADRLAKKGARAHFASEHWHAALKADKDQETLADLCTWIGDALSDWPPEKQVRRRAMDRAGMRERRAHRRRMAREVGGHRLFWGRDGWRCRYCGTEARTQSGARRVLERPCPGHTVARLPRQEEHGVAAHVLWTAEADDAQRQMGADVTWCAVCGAYSSAKLYKLKGRCTGPAQGAALTRLRSFQRLRHPVIGYLLKKPHRATDDFLDAAADRGDVRRRMYDDAMRVHSDAGADAATYLQPTHIADESMDQGGAVPAGGDNDTVGTNLGEGIISENEDVFGHGGGLDEEGHASVACLEVSTDEVRPVPCGHGADGGARLVLRHSAHRRGYVGPRVAGQLEDGEQIDALDADECRDDPHDAGRKRGRVSAPDRDIGTATSGGAAAGGVVRRRITFKRAENVTTYEATAHGGDCNADAAAGLDHGRPGLFAESETRSSQASPGTYVEDRPCWDSGNATSSGDIKRASTDSCGSEAADRHSSAALRIAAVRERVLARLTASATSHGKAEEDLCSETAATTEPGDAFYVARTDGAKRRRLRGKGPLHRGNGSRSFDAVHEAEAKDEANVGEEAGHRVPE